MMLLAVAAIALCVLPLVPVSAQSHNKRRPSHATICGNPKVTCKTTVTFQPYDLPFRVPANAVILDTVPFYAVILKSVNANEDDCNAFIPENDRLAAQALFPENKVFTSRCADVETLYYTNTNPKARLMAVYAGTTPAESRRILAAVKATGRFADAYVKRMQTGFNGT
jgi:hypothetical protein